ncbi:hypothetical protein STEG23_017759 [Scotinomys teguina]
MDTPSGTVCPNKPSIDTPSGTVRPNKPSTDTPPGTVCPNKPSINNPSGTACPHKPSIDTPSGTVCPNKPSIDTPSGTVCPKKPSLLSFERVFVLLDTTETVSPFLLFWFSVNPGYGLTLEDLELGISAIVNRTSVHIGENICGVGCQVLWAYPKD